MFYVDSGEFESNTLGGGDSVDSLALTDKTGEDAIDESYHQVRALGPRGRRVSASAVAQSQLNHWRLCPYAGRPGSYGGPGGGQRVVAGGGANARGQRGL